MKNLRKGAIIVTGLTAPPEKHEYNTAKYFAERGFDIEFISPTYIKGLTNPDFKMAGKIWETKSPVRPGRTFEDNLRKAMQQSENIIFDLRRISQRDEKWCINKLIRQSNSYKIKTLIAITRAGELLTIKGRFDIIET